MNEVLFSRRGGGYTSRISTSALAGRASWPFAKLVLRQNDLTFTLMRRATTLVYEDIKEVGLSKSGYVVVTAKDPNQSFAYTWLGLPTIIEILRQHNVSVEDNVPGRRMLTARLAIAGQLVFFACFVVLAAIVLLTGHVRR